MKEVFFEYKAPPHIIMADIVEANVITDRGRFRKEVIEDLKNVLNSIAPYARHTAFRQFLKELDERKVLYDRKHFQF